MKDTGLLEALESSTGEATSTKHYNGEVELFFDAGLHAYFTIQDGVKYLVPGSTTIGAMLDKPALVQWSANQTVELVLSKLIEDAGEESVTARLRAYYERMRAKMPWDDIEDVQLSISGHHLVKTLNEARFNFREISKDATDVGHMAHEWLEFVIKCKIRGEEVALPLPSEERAARCCEAALKWMELHKFRPVAAEQKVYSREYGYSGTFDWTAYITACGDPECCPFEGEHKELGDFKSSRDIYEEYFIQTASYQKALEEEFPEDPYDGRRILRLGKDDGAFDSVFRPNDTLESDFSAFAGLLDVYVWKKQMELDRKYEKQVLKAQKDAEKAAEKERKALERARRAAEKPKRAPRKAKIKEVEPAVMTGGIPVEGDEPAKRTIKTKPAVMTGGIPVEGDEPAKRTKTKTFVPIPVEGEEVVAA
jgi:hypothetical protein